MRSQGITLVIGSVVAVLLCGAGAWMTWRAFSRAGEVEQSRDNSLKRIKAIYGKDPFPSGTNVLVVKADRGQLDAWVAATLDMLRAGSVTAPTNALSPSLFIERLQRTVRDLRQAAAGGPPMVPENFSFGFQQYLGSSGIMPQRPADVPRLAMQLGMTEALVREILAAKVTMIEEVQREVFEGGAGEAASAPAAGRRVRFTGPSPATAPVASGRYPRHRFVFAFTATEKAMDAVVDRLAAMPLFAAVSDIQIRREERGLRPAPAKTADNAKAPVPPRAQRVVSGPEVAPRLRVRMQVDVYSFEGV